MTTCEGMPVTIFCKVVKVMTNFMEEKEKIFSMEGAVMTIWMVATMVVISILSARDMDKMLLMKEHTTMQVLTHCILRVG